MKNDSSKIIVGLLTLTIVVSGCLGLLESEGEGETPEDIEEPVNGEDENNEEETSPLVVHEDISEDEVDREVELEGDVFDWVPDEIEVEEGETVEFRVEGVELNHEFEITNHTEPMFVEEGEEEVKTVTFEESGSYEFVCALHAEGGMTGTIEVS